MSKKKKLSQADQAAREREVLAAPPDMSNQAVRQLMSPEFEQMSNLDASAVALMLQEIVRGQNSLLARYDETNIQIAAIRERQDRADKEIAERLASQQAFIQEVLDRAESLKRVGEAQDKMIANGVAQWQQAVNQARADKIAKDLAFKEQLAREPKVTIVSAGQLVTTMQHGQQVARIIPEEVHIKGIHWRLPIGRAIEVPQSIATYLEQRKASQEETAKRAELLGQQMEATEMAKKWSEIEGSKTDPMPI